MTDEAKPMLEDVFAPWRAWPEWSAFTQSVGRALETGDVKTVFEDADALCVRVWREARRDKADAHAALDAALDKATGDMLEAERTRADAAEAQRDRLAAALTRLHDAIDDFNAGSEKDDDARQHLCWLCGASTYGGDGVIHESRCAVLIARAALADVREREDA